MDTRNKLDEARYFLQKLLELKDDPELFNDALYNLSAFLSAWRSVLDVMLYDFAEYYQVGLNREDKITLYEFKLSTKILNHKKASEFVQWFNKKWGLLEKNPLWKMRNIIIHRGYPDIAPYSIYIPFSATSGATYTFLEN